MNPIFFRALRNNEIRVHELNYLFWECTTRCNFRCRHCGSDCGIAEREKDMPLADFLAAVDTIPQKERAKNFNVTLTGVLRTGVKSEFTVTAGTSWNHNKLIKCPVFGIDPLGQPRLNVEEGTPAGTLESSPEFSLLFQYRHLWNPQNALVCYSGIGAGFSTAMGFCPIPSFTPLALRLGGEHIYGFVEGTVSILATFVHGGLGWRF